MLKRACFAFCLLAICALSAAAADVPGQYRVSANVLVDGQPIASPTLVVETGSKATVEGEGADAYVLEVSLKDMGGDNIGVVAKLRVGKKRLSTGYVTVPGRQQRTSNSNLGLELTVDSEEG